jgi:hypothetical protein
MYSSTDKEKILPSAADVDDLLKGDIEFTAVALWGK